ASWSNFLGIFQIFPSTQTEQNLGHFKEEWLKLYRNKTVKAGMSAMQSVTHEDEWLVEAYMETDYSTLTVDDFQTTVNGYLAYLVKEGVFTDEVIGGGE
ncbi:hypothetical protein L3H34_08455, partial [Corynebacterium sp. MC-22]|nr:hypothetical protein [Corynebacterium parakroppenstedtii]